MPTQAELPLYRPQPVDESRRGELLAYLADGNWHTAREIREDLQLSDRELRQIVEQDESAEILSFPGSPGYKLFVKATIEEIERTKALKSQGREMLRRFVRYQRRRHANTWPSSR